MHIWRYDVRPRNDRDSRGNVIYNVRIVLRHAFERGETEMLNARYLCPENPLHGPPEILSQNLGKFGGEKYRATALHKNRPRVARPYSGPTRDGDVNGVLGFAIGSPYDPNTRIGKDSKKRKISPSISPLLMSAAPKRCMGNKRGSYITTRVSP